MDPEKENSSKLNLKILLKRRDILPALMGDKVEPRRLFYEQHALES